jgi:hypothetical protein
MHTRSTRLDSAARFCRRTKTSCVERDPGDSSGLRPRFTARGSAGGHCVLEPGAVLSQVGGPPALVPREVHVILACLGPATRARYLGALRRRLAARVMRQRRRAASTSSRWLRCCRAVRSGAVACCGVRGSPPRATRVSARDVGQGKVAPSRCAAILRSVNPHF